MSEIFTCDDTDTLVAYLYGEIDVPTRRRVDDHLRTCAACADEVSALQSVRNELSEWAPPEPQLGFRIVQDLEAVPAAVLRPARWWSAAIPVWAQAAAAVVVLAAGAAIANVQVRSDASGWMISTGWMTPAAAPVADGQNMAAPSLLGEGWQPALASLAEDLRREMRQREPAVVPVSGIRASSDSEVLLRRVSALIAQSEQRQRQELALRMTQIDRDFQVQRRADLVRFNQAFGQFEGRTGAEVARQRQMLDYIVRVSQPQQ